MSLATPQRVTGRHAFTLALLACVVPMFTVTMNNLVMTGALPTIGADLKVGLDLLQWFFNSYALVFAAGLPAAAAIGARLGNRQVYLAAVLLFAGASVVCALASDPGVLIAGRILQGVGAAAVVPLSLVLLVGSVPAAQQKLAVGLWSGMAGLALAAGAVIGGALTSGLNWRWIFWMNLPVAAVAVPLVLLVLRRSPRGTRPPDLLGMTLLGGAIALVVWAVSESPRLGWLSPTTLGALAGVVVCLLVFVWWQRRTSQPLLPLSFYRNRPLLLSNLACLTLYFGVFGSVFFLMQYLQGPMGYSPAEAGVRTLPWTCMPLLVAPLTGLLLARVRAGVVLTVAAVLQAIGLGWIALIAAPGLPWLAVVPAMVVAGTGMGMEFAVTNEVAMRSVPEDQQNMAAAYRNTAAEIGGVLGVAVLTTVFTVSRAGAGPDPDVGFVAGLSPVLGVGALVVLLGAGLGVLLARQERRDADAPATPTVAADGETREPVATGPRSS
jgi:EmrB/QacA subfamily drug resistance transporter